MPAYLLEHPGALRQYGPRTTWRPGKPTGMTNLHTSEFPTSWTALQQAAWLQARTTPGCYHDIADTHGGDLQMVPYEFGAWQDGTGSNGMAMSIGFICRTTDWRAMTPGARRRTLAAGARAFARQQAWLKAHGYPTTPLRYITKAQSDAGMAGFCCHGWRDPDRRTDPGVASPNLFPFDEWLEACAAALAGTDTTPPLSLGDDMRLIATPDKTVWKVTDYDVTPEPGIYRMGAIAKGWGLTVTQVSLEEFRDIQADILARRGRLLGDIAKVSASDVDEKGLAVELAPLLRAGLIADLSAAGVTVSDDQLDGALRRVLGSLDTAA